MNTLLLERSGTTGAALTPALVPWYSTTAKTYSTTGPTLHFGEFVRTSTVTHNANRCWDGYRPVPGKEAYSNDSCEKKGEKKKKKRKRKKKDGDVSKSRENASRIYKKGEDAGKKTIIRTYTLYKHVEGYYTRPHVPPHTRVYIHTTDGDGKTGEGKKKVTDFSDRNGNKVPDAFESSSSSEYDTDSESSTGGNAPMSRKRSNSSLAKKAKGIADAAKQILSLETFAVS
jgi:hypothetical protein